MTSLRPSPSGALTLLVGVATVTVGIDDTREGAKIDRSPLTVASTRAATHRVTADHWLSIAQAFEFLPAEE